MSEERKRREWMTHFQVRSDATWFWIWFALLWSLLFAVAGDSSAQSLQQIQPSDSLEVRRQKTNSNFTLLNSKIATNTAVSHTHANKPTLDLVPGTLGGAHKFLALNAANNGFEFKTLVAGTGITITPSGANMIISVNAGTGLASLNGLTGSTQTFTNDTNVGFSSSGTAHVVTWTGILSSGRGGTGNGFTKFSGPASTEKTFTLPNASGNILTDNALVTVPQGGSGAGNLTGLLKGNGTSPFTAVTAPTGSIVGTTDAQTLSSKVLASPDVSSFARFLAEAEGRFYDADNSNYLAWKAPSAVATNKSYLMPPITGVSNNWILTIVDTATGETQWAAAPGASGGEANTASNVGTGSGWFKTKAGVDLQFKSFIAASSKLSITSNTNDLTVDVVEANLNRANMAGVTPVAGGGLGVNSLTGIPVGNGISPVTTKAAPTGSIVGTTDSQTLDHKTIDVEAAGNVITTVSKVWLEAASCNGTEAGPMFDTLVSNVPVAACVVGSNTVKGVLDFADGSADLTAQRTLALPSDWSGAVDVTFKWFTPATTGNVVFGIATACVGDAQTDDPTFNGYSDVTDIAKGTANQLNDASISAITTTGCAAGKLMHIRIARRLSQSADTVAAAARLVGVELTLRRSQ